MPFSNGGIDAMSLKCTRCGFIAALVIVFANLAFGQNEGKLTLHYLPTTGLSIVIQHDIHQKYGFAYPETYELSLPAGSAKLSAYERYSISSPWIPLPAKGDTDSFNGAEVVRFDYADNMAYVSASFPSNSDSLYIRIVDDSGNPVTPGFQGISKYYDNRQGVVTVSADDWSDWVVQPGWFTTLLHLFRSHGLYVTVGVITGSSSASTWQALQSEVDSGYIEVASHSRTHPATPYADPQGEIGGSADDILNSVTLPPPFRSGQREYVYTWIAPYGNYDNMVDSLLGAYSYLDARLYANLDTTSPREYVYGASALTGWDAARGHFKPFLPSVELGAPSWGGGDTSLVSLDSLFDFIVSEGGVYHLMWHPQVIFSDIGKRYLHGHLDYISGRRNIWYANLGVVYLYHFLQEANATPVDAIAERGSMPVGYDLYQNYPNPFNPSTVITYRMSDAGHVTLKVFDVLGREVVTLVDQIQKPGTYEVRFDGSRLPTGLYFCRLDAGNYFAVRKLLLLK